MAMGDKLLGAEGRWLMGRVIPRQFLDGVGEYLEHFAPDARDVLAAIKARAEEIVEADEDMATDGPGKGALASCAVVLASYEKLLPVFEGDERRTILFLQHVMGGVLERPYEILLGTLSKGQDALDKLEKACGSMKAIYPAYFEWEFGRPDPGTFDMKVKRCFFHDFFARHDAELLTTIMCAFDVTFMQAIDPRGQRFARRAHLADLARRRRVPVHGSRDRRPARRGKDKLDQRFADTQESA